MKSFLWSEREKSQASHLGKWTRRPVHSPRPYDGRINHSSMNAWGGFYLGLIQNFGSKLIRPPAPLELPDQVFELLRLPAGQQASLLRPGSWICQAEPGIP